MTWPPPPQAWLGRAAVGVVTCATYVAAGRAGLLLASIHESASPVWPATGLAIGALLVGGLGLWPAVFAGAFIVNLAFTSASLPAVLAIAAGNTLEAVVGAWTVRRFAGGVRALDDPRGVLKFAALAGVLAPVVSAGIGVTSLVLFGSASWSEHPRIWLTWWLGDATGAMLVAPLIIHWFAPPTAPPERDGRRLAETLVLLLLVVAVGLAVFGGQTPLSRNHYPIAYIFFPLLAWPAFRLGARATVSFAALGAALAVSGTALGWGPFVRESPNESLIVVELYVAVTVITALAVGAGVNQVKRVRAALHESEDRLAQAQRLEAVGRLAGGVAHSFNNLLTVMLGYAELADEQAPETSPVRGHVRRIIQAGQQAASITQQLLAFGRRQLLKPSVIDLNDVVRQTEALLRPLLGERHRVVSVLATELPFTKADRSQLEQAVMNLVLNARDAMPEGGEIHVATATAEVPPGAWSEEGGIAGACVTVSVRDTGVGMDAEARARLFEPFYTTKEVGRGTGLGLASVYGIVKQSGGHVVAESELGRGSTFTIYMPAVTGVQPPEVVATTHAPRGTETVLVVEDEEAVRKFVELALRGKGYRVIGSPNASEALELLARHGDGIDLVLTDVVLPGMSGREMARRIRDGHPELPIAFMSGYAQVEAEPGDVPGPFMAKPLSAASLSRLIREMLDSRPAARSTEDGTA